MNLANNTLARKVKPIFKSFMIVVPNAPRMSFFSRLPVILLLKLDLGFKGTFNSYPCDGVQENREGSCDFIQPALQEITLWRLSCKIVGIIGLRY